MTEEIREIKKVFTPGMRVRLNYMDDSHALKPGSIGTVDHVDDMGQIHMKWDNGSTLALIYGVDSFKII